MKSRHPIQGYGQLFLKQLRQYQGQQQPSTMIAHVHWYNHLPERKAMSLALGCPVFRASYMDDSRANMWPVEKLAPRQLAAVYHKTGKDCVVILSRFANLLETVPT